MIFTDVNNNQLTTEVAVGDNGLNVYAKDDNGNPLEVFWVLVGAGNQVNNARGTTFVNSKTYWFGTLDQFTSPVPVSTIVSGPSLFTFYQRPTLPYLMEDGFRATLTAVPVGGGASRQIMLAVSAPRKGNF